MNAYVTKTRRPALSVNALPVSDVDMWWRDMFDERCMCVCLFVGMYM